MKVLIIGNHAAGLTAAEILRKHNKSVDITMVSKEDTIPYSRCLISDIISGEKQIKDILFKNTDFYKKYNINTIFGKTVTDVIPENNEVILNDNSKLSYDNLIIATGADSVLPDIKGINLKGVFGLRTDIDAEEIKKYSTHVKNAVVLGGGLVGIKAAIALCKAGKKTTVIVSSSSILSQIISEEEANILEKNLELAGINFLKNTKVTEILGAQKVEGIKTLKNNKIDCELIIAAKGVKANMDIIKNTKIKTDYGILIDESCRTNVKNIYAAGDVTQSKDSIRNENWMNSIWPLAVEEGKIAAENILGKNIKLRERTSMNAFHIADTWLVSCGLTGLRENKENIEQFFIRDENNKNYKKFIFKENRLIGYALLGNILNAGVLTLLIRKQINLLKVKNQILEGRYDFSSLIPFMMENKECFTEPEFIEIFKSLQDSN
jgi:NAD(P)H-nitrite reductase large subunit